MSNRPSIPKGSTTPIDYVYIQYADGVAKLPVKQASKFLYCYNLILLMLTLDFKVSFMGYQILLAALWSKKAQGKTMEVKGSHPHHQRSGNVTVELGGGEKEVSRCINCDGAGALTCTACQGSGIQPRYLDRSHQDSLAHAIADEMHKVYTKELRPTPVPLTVDGEVIDEEDMYFLDANNESDDDVEGKDVDEKDGADLEKRDSRHQFSWSSITTVDLYDVEQPENIIDRRNGESRLLGVKPLLLFDLIFCSCYVIATKMKTVGSYVNSKFVVEVDISKNEEEIFIWPRTWEVEATVDANKIPIHLTDEPLSDLFQEPNFNQHGSNNPPGPISENEEITSPQTNSQEDLLSPSTTINEVVTSEPISESENIGAVPTPFERPKRLRLQVSDLGVDTVQGLKKIGVSGGDGFEYEILVREIRWALIGSKSRVALMLAWQILQLHLASLRHGLKQKLSSFMAEDDFTKELGVCTVVVISV
ncbi:hypothetical protein L1987_22102 [Smallanthus sonchifolius]|uniref:Uncharacterized protein n=1 Tax=Smallanthus sonchifolius TaxID=185202 RepID=A0ACB9IDX7_9ASTR|nr:hypothetical protein L1987_22102 [Smallanthus sonchifolius]